jgi:hypothetical protein
MLLLLTFLFCIQWNCFSEQLTGWENPLKINDTRFASNPEFINNQRIAGIIYIDSTFHTNGLYCSITTDEGRTWSKPRYILESTSGRLYPISAISKNNIIYVTFNDDDDLLYFTKSTNLGMTWLKPMRLPTKSTFSFLPKIIVDAAGSIHIFYHEEMKGKFTLYQMTSKDSGTTWTEPKVVLKDLGITDPSKERGNFFPTIVSFHDSLYMALQSRSGGGEEKIYDELYFVSSLDNGKTWANPTRLTFQKMDDVRPFLIQHPSETLGTNVKTELHLFWERNVSNAWNIFHQKGLVLRNNEIDWGDAEQFTFSQNGAHYPQAFMYKDLMYLFWYQFYDGMDQIFFKTYNFTEKQWSPEKRFTYDKTDNKREVCTTLASNIFVCWQSEDKKKNSSSIILRSLDRSTPKPVLYSESHKEGVYSTNRHLKMSINPIDDPSGIKGYAYILDSNPGTVPDIMNSEFSNFSTEIDIDRDGVQYFHLRSIDKADNWSETATFKVCIDTSLPEILSISSPDFNEGLSTSTASGSFIIQAQAVSGMAGYSFSLGSGQAVPPVKRILSSSNVIPVTVQAKGDVVFTVSAMNNTGKWSSPRSFKFKYQGDITPPSAPFVSSLTHPESLVSSNRDARFTWRSDDASGIRGYSYSLSLESNTPVPEKVLTTATQWTFSGLKNGRYFLQVRSEDTAENWSGSATYSFTVFADKEGPVFTAFDLATDIQEFMQTTNSLIPELAFHWNAEDGSGIRDYRYFFTDRLPRDHDFDWTTILSNGIVFTNLSRENYYFYLTADDIKGNQSSVTMMPVLLSKAVVVTSLTDNITHPAGRRIDWVEKIRTGDTLTRIISRVLKVRNADILKGLTKSVAWYNLMGDLDLIYPDDKIRFPVVTVSTDDLSTPQQTAQLLLGCTNRKSDLITPDRRQKDKLILRDRYFLKYGRMKPITGRIK